jgi:hypothetical protein
MDFLAEYDEMHTIPPKIAVSYKFLNLFHVVIKDGSEKRGLYWTTDIVDSKLSDDALLAIKVFLKTKKASLLKGVDKEHSKILWFFYQKLLELGAFDITIRSEIRAYLDLCQYILL